MQSLDSSCQEADFIINDTLKKLKDSSTGVNSNSNSAISSLSALNPSSSSGSNIRQHHQLIYQQNQQQQPKQQYSQYQHLQTALQDSTSPQTQTQQLSTPPPLPVPLSSISFSSKNSLLDPSLLHCNISQIPNKPPFCIFDGGAESPPEVPPIEILASSGNGNGSGSGLDGLAMLTDTLSTAAIPAGTNSLPSPSSCSSSTNLSNFNSITSPSPVVPDLLLSTPPGINSSPCSVVLTTGFGSSVGTPGGLLTSSQFLATAAIQQSTNATHQSNNNNVTTNNNNNNNNKKADKRPSSSLPASSTTASGSLSTHSNSNAHHHYQHSSHHHLSHLPSTSTASASATASPTSSPSKRQKISKDSSLSIRSTSGASPSTSSRSNSSSNNTASAKRDSSTTPGSSSSSTTATASSALKIINFNEKIKEQYLELLAEDLSFFADKGVKQRARSLTLERLVEIEKLNTIVVNLYPGNKGYALALYYDERQYIPPNGDLINVADSSTIMTSSESGTLLTTASAAATSHKSASSRNASSGISKIVTACVPSETKTSSDFDATEFKTKGCKSNCYTTLKGSIRSVDTVSEYSLVEVLRWPYESDQLLQCIDLEIIPDFIMDMLNAPSITLTALQDDSEPSRSYVKPNVFYGGCVVAQIRDFRQTFANSTDICDIKHVLLRPNNATVFADVQHLVSTTNLSSSMTTGSVPTAICLPEDKLQVESQLILAAAEPLCLEPDPNIGRYAINAQNERQLFNTHAMRRQMKKYSQISINRKRKLDQFTTHYGQDLHAYLTKLRARPRTSANTTTTTITAATSNSLLVSAMLSSLSTKVPKRPRDVIRPIRPPRLEYPPNLKLPDPFINVEKFAKTFERPRETTDCQPQLMEEYILETEREDNEGRRVIYHIKLSIFQRPSNSEYLGELYVDRDYREGKRNGESCRFSLGTRTHANRYINQFTEIFTEEGRKAVKITHLMPGHLPKVSHTGISSEQRQVLLLQQQQRQAAVIAAQQQPQQQQVQTTTAPTTQQLVTAAPAQQQTQQAQQQHVVVVGPNGQQQHILPATVQHVTTVTPQQQQQQSHIIGQSPQQQQHIAITSGAKNINIVGLTASNAAAVQQVLRQQQQQQQHQQQITTQFIDANGTTVQLHPTQSGTAGSIATHSQSTAIQQQPQPAQHIQLHPVAGNTTTQLSLSNGSLVLVQQHPAPQHQQQQTLQQQQTQTLQHAGITIQPANLQPQHQQQKTQVITAAQLNAVTTQNSALRTQLSSSVPILQSQVKNSPIHSTQQQQQLLHKSSQQQQNTATSNNSTNASSNTTLHSNATVNAIVTSIMNSVNQYQQQKQQQQQQQPSTNNSSSSSSSSSSNNGITSTTVKSSSNASIRSLLNSAPAAMTSTPVASGTFTTSTGQHQTVTLVQHTPSSQQHQAQQQQTIVSSDNFVQVTPQMTTGTAQQRKQTNNEVLQNLLNPNRKFNIVASGSNIVTTNASGTTFRTSAGNLVAVNLNQAGQQQDPQQQTTSTQGQQTHQTVRVSMSALASQLASPPAIMTNPSSNFGYTVSTVGGTNTSVGPVTSGTSSGSIKILNSGVQQQRVLANALRRDSNTTAPPNAIVVGVAAPSPGSDSNASNASGFAVPQATSNSVGPATSLTLLGAATPSPSGSDHSQSSSTAVQNQALLERLNSGGNATAVATAIPNMSPQQQTHTQYLTKTLVQSPAASSIHSPMSSPHPQPSPSPQQQQQTTTTLNLQGINLLQGAIANFPGLQNVQVQIPGLAQPLSLQLPGNTLQAAVQQHNQQQQQANTATVSVVTASSGTGNNSTVTGNAGSQQAQLQQRSLLVSVPVSTNTQQQTQQHTITLQAAQPSQQSHSQHVPPTGTIVNLPSGAATTAATQTVVLTNTSGAGGTGGANATGGGGTTTMLTLPIAQFVGPGVQKLNPQTIRTSSGGGVAGGSIVVQQQPPQQQQQTQPHPSQQQQQQQQQQTTTTTINVSGGSGGNSSQQAAIQLVGTLQQRPRNIQVVGTKQLSGAQRQLIATQRNIGGSTLKIATTPINVSAANAITTTTNLTATPIVMSTQKLQLKTIKAPQQQNQQQLTQQHTRILNQVTATAASQTQTSQNHQQQQTVIIGQPQQQHIQITGRATAAGGTNLNQQLFSVIAAKAAKQQQQAANRRRSATDVNK